MTKLLELVELEVQELTATTSQATRIRSCRVGL